MVDFSEKLIFCIEKLDLVPIVTFDGSPKSGKSLQSLLFFEWLNSYLPKERLGYIENKCNEAHCNEDMLPEVNANTAFSHYLMMMDSLKNNNNYLAYVSDKGYYEFEFFWHNKIDPSLLTWFRTSPAWEPLLCSIVICDTNETLLNRGMNLTSEDLDKNSHVLDYVNSLFVGDNNAIFIAENTRIIFVKCTNLDVEKMHTRITEAFTHLVEDTYDRLLFNKNNDLSTYLKGKIIAQGSSAKN